MSPSPEKAWPKSSRVGPSRRRQSPSQAVSGQSGLRHGLGDACRVPSPLGAGQVDLGKCKVGSRRQRSNYGALVEGGPRGPGAGLYLGRAAMRALEAISTGCRNSKELVFQQSERKINQQIKAAAATAGLDRDNTGLSPRVGVAQTSALRVGDCGPS